MRACDGALAASIGSRASRAPVCAKFPRALREAKAAAQQEEAARVVRRAREDEQLARREAEMASKEQQWATRYAELSAQAEMRASARRLRRTPRRSEKLWAKKHPNESKLPHERTRTNSH